MSYIKDIMDAGEGIHGLLISLITCPFWYIVFYLFPNDIILSDSVVPIICFCFCLSFVGTILGIIIFAIYDSIRGEDEVDFTIISLTSLSYRIIIMALLILIFYSYGRYNTSIIYAYGFILIYFGILIFTLGVVIFFGFKKKSSK